MDLEIIDPLVVPDAVLTKDEQSLAATIEDLCAWWSAKEALAKALGDARNYDPRRLGSPALWKNGCEGRWTARKIFVSTGVIGWIVWESDQAAVARHFGASAR